LYIPCGVDLCVSEDAEFSGGDPFGRGGARNGRFPEIVRLKAGSGLAAWYVEKDRPNGETSDAEPPLVSVLSSSSRLVENGPRQNREKTAKTC
jgi:hypothetical protein